MVTWIVGEPYVIHDGYCFIEVGQDRYLWLYRIQFQEDRKCKHTTDLCMSGLN